MIKKYNPVFLRYVWNRQHILGQAPQAHNHGKYNNIGKVWYFRFDDDNNMSYKYIKLSYENILSIT